MRSKANWSATTSWWKYCKSDETKHRPFRVLEFSSWDGRPILIEHLSLMFTPTQKPILHASTG